VQAVRVVLILGRIRSETQRERDAHWRMDRESGCSARVMVAQCRHRVIVAHPSGTS
jgi:hypothetical protein